MRPTLALQVPFRTCAGEVAIGSEDADFWREEAIAASNGVVLLQTCSVLRHPIRLLQLFAAAREGYPLVCVHVIGGNYDFASVCSWVHRLPTQQCTQGFRSRGPSYKPTGL